MQTLNLEQLSGANDVPHSFLFNAIQSKLIPIIGTTSAATYLTAYSTDLGTAAASLPQVINFIGTHGPVAWLSWADLMAFTSFALVIINLSLAGIKIGLWIKKGIKKLTARPRKRARKNG